MMPDISLEEAAMRRSVSNNTFRDDYMEGFSIFETEFAKCTFVNCVFDGARIGLSKFYDCRFTDCSFRDTQMLSCEFYNSSTDKSCVWNRCDLSDMKFDKCDLSQNVLTDCKGFLLRIDDCQVTGASFKIDVHRQVSARLVIGGISCRRSNLTETNFRELNLEGSTFDSCDLRGADFSKCNLSSVSFVGSNMGNLQLFRANLTGARIAHAEISDLALDDVLSLDELLVSRDQHDTLLSFFRIRTEN